MMSRGWKLYIHLYCNISMSSGWNIAHTNLSLYYFTCITEAKASLNRLATELD